MVYIITNPLRFGYSFGNKMVTVTVRGQLWQFLLVFDAVICYNKNVFVNLAGYALLYGRRPI